MATAAAGMRRRRRGRGVKVFKQAKYLSLSMFGSYYIISQ
jgi:hypothetical protein